LFSVDELTKAIGSKKNRKAPGPDNIPTAESRPDILLNMYSKCLQYGIFPDP